MSHPIAGRIDLNRADADTLAQLPGLSPALAARIVADRDARGPFVTADELVRVSGIGPATLVAVRDHVTAGGNVIEFVGTIEQHRPDDAEPGLALNQATPYQVLRYDIDAGVVTHLHVRALLPHGLRRAGRRWPGGQGTVIAAADLDASQLDSLLAEPRLRVTAATDPAASNA